MVCPVTYFFGALSRYQGGRPFSVPNYFRTDILLTFYIGMLRKCVTLEVTPNVTCYAENMLRLFSTPTDDVNCELGYRCFCFLRFVN